LGSAPPRAEPRGTKVAVFEQAANPPEGFR
jgi:hypothetical protein